MRDGALATPRLRLSGMFPIAEIFTLFLQFMCESLPLVPGEYKIHVGLNIALREVDWVEDVARLAVVTSDFYGTGVLPMKGVFLLNNRWSLDHEREVAS